MKHKFWLMVWVLVTQLGCCTAAFANQEENRLMAVFLGRFASYIEMPDRGAKNFTITVIDENPFGTLLDDLYFGKLINGKPVVVRYATRMEEVGLCDLLFVTLVNPRARQDAIAYGARNSILTISTATGFAERGGIIQLDFLQQQTRIKINHAAAQKANIRIGAPLLSLATVVKGVTP